MKNIYLMIIIAVMATLAGCKGGDVSSTVREAEMALADGDMTAARSVADKVLGPESIEKLTATDLARLSLVYMEMADKEADNNTVVATAADLYRRAMKINADSARAFYLSLPPERVPLAVQLFHIVTATDSAQVIPADEPIDPDATPF